MIIGERPTIIYVEIGRLPTYLWVALTHSRSANRSARIILVTDQDIGLSPEIASLDVEIFRIDIQELKSLLPLAEGFEKKFKRIFWYYTSLRFFAIRVVMERLKLSRIVHLESDYLLYLPVESIQESIPNSCSVALNCEPLLVIPGMLYLSDSDSAKVVCEAIEEGLRRGMADFHALYSLIENGVSGVYCFPTIASVEDHRLAHVPRLNFSGGLFDAAAVGHRLAGTDREPFRSWTSDYTSWGKDDLIYFKNPARCDQPLLRKGGRLYPIWGLHTHAKRLECLATFYGSLDPISGCKCLEWADQVVCLNQGFAYASRVGIERNRIVLLDEESPLPPAGSILAVSGDEVYALPTNWMMKVRALGGLVFLVANSDRGHDVTELYRTFGERNVVFAQNLLPSPIEHQNIRPLPIGVQNRIWPEINVHSVMTSRARKVFGILSSLASTHRSRIPAVFWSLVMATRLPHLEKPLEIRVHKWMGLLRGLYRSLRTGHVHGYRMPLSRWRTLLRGSFFVLSLRGNGADTHRFWEGQYHGAIPLLRPEDDLPAYSGWPRLVRSLRPIFLRGVRQQDITDAMARRDVRLIKGANEYEHEIRAAARALGEICPR